MDEYVITDWLPLQTPELQQLLDCLEELHEPTIVAPDGCSLFGAYVMQQASPQECCISWTKLREATSRS